MKFDTVIIGGGLAGLVCGISLAKQGQRCVIVSSGQSALHFSSGSLDLLNALPDGRKVKNPLEAIEQLVLQWPEHPYAKLGTIKFTELAQGAGQFLEQAGVSVSGTAGRNRYRVTPMGTLKPTWLTLKDQFASENEDRLPWKKIAIFNIAGFLDFYTQFIADEFQRIGTVSTLHTFNLPVLEHLRSNPSEMRSVNIARVFNQRQVLEQLVQTLKIECEEDCEAIVLPAVIGLEDQEVARYLQNEVGREICLLSTLPPSVPGIRTQQQLCRHFRQLGGVYMLGDAAVKAEREGNRITRIWSANHGDIPFVAEQVVLATGSFFSEGLKAAPDRIYEPVFGLDVMYPKDREQWYDLNLFAAQQYQSFGVKTDRDFRGICSGQVLDNLYVAGAVLGGFNALKEGSGAGVSILSGLYVAERILNQ